jgi:uncharacterized protein (TIGR03435 family)
MSLMTGVRHQLPSAQATVVFVLIVVTVLQAPRLAAQSAPSVDASAIALGVGSIKPNSSGNPMGLVNVNSAGVFRGINLTTRGLILMAYGLHNTQLNGGPTWIGTDRFDVIAKPPEDVTQGQLSDFGSERMQLMLRSLLAERFKFASHAEMKELPVFILTKARSDGKLGPSIRPTTADCAARELSTTPPPPLSRVGELPTCTAMAGFGRYAAGNRPIATLVRYLQGDRLILDRTGLKGNFDLNLEFAPNQVAGGSGSSASADSDRPSMFIALQEQLGLKLESATMPVAVLVVDHIERPTAN